MNKLLVDALARRPVQRGCARMLSELPQATRVLPLVKAPAKAAFAAVAESLRTADPYTPTRCAGWAVHELTAHLAAGSAEIAELVELELAGKPARPTRDFDERESPYRALAPKVLRRSFFREALRAVAAIERLSAAGAGARVAFTGCLLDAPTLVLHVESELVLHRWDIVGSDETSVRALSDPRIGWHAVTTVVGMRPNVFPPRRGDVGTVILRSPGNRDVAVTGGAVTTIGPASKSVEGPVVRCHPAVRTLLLWGRQPERDLPAPEGDTDAVDAVTAMLRPDGIGSAVP